MDCFIREFIGEFINADLLLYLLSFSQLNSIFTYEEDFKRRMVIFEKFFEIE
jgi:hypothetical protein